MINGSDGKFEYILLSRLLVSSLRAYRRPRLSQKRDYVLSTDVSEEACGTLDEHSFNSETWFRYRLSSPSLFSDPGMTGHIREHSDPSIRVLGHCVRALIVNKLAADIEARAHPTSDAEFGIPISYLWP